MKRYYEKPAMRVYELQHRTQLLIGSIQTSVEPDFNSFGDEEEWQ